MTAYEKPRILYVKHILETYSDEEHTLSLNDIIKRLEQDYDLKAHRTTLTRDINELIAYGMDIVTVRSTQNRYFVGTRLLEMPELRLLHDAIASSKCLTDKKSDALTEKLSALCSIHQAATLRERIGSVCADKPQNESIYYIIDAIYEAMQLGRKIAFYYTEYTPAKELVLRGDGEQYVLSPYACVWNGDYYYVIGWSDKREDITAFRVDRIAGCPTLCDGAVVPPPAGLNIGDYTKSLFHMYSGEAATVELLCDNELMKTVIDRFGADVQTAIVDDAHFKVTADISLSPTFYGWLFEFGGKIRLLSPDKALAAYKAMVTAAFNNL